MKFLSTLLDGVTEYETLVSAVERHNTPAAGKRMGLPPLPGMGSEK